VSAQRRIQNRGDATLVRIQNRALWLAVQMIYHANQARTEADGVKGLQPQRCAAPCKPFRVAVFLNPIPGVAPRMHPRAERFERLWHSPNLVACQ